MSLWLCRQEQVKRPYYVEGLGIHLHSSQELAYIIYHYPLIALDGFVNDGLLVFLREELNQGFLALKVERWLKSQEDPDEVLMLILQECDYYTPQEISQYRRKIAALRKKHPAEFGKMKADEVFSMKQYGRAVKLYQEILEYPPDQYVDDKFLGRVWNNLGSCYARMFQMDKAYEAYEKAFSGTGSQEVLERMYYLTQFDSRVVMGERFQAMMTEERQDSWEEHLQEVQELSAQSEAVWQLRDLFSQDSTCRLEGAAGLLQKWKQEYRGMV